MRGEAEGAAGRLQTRRGRLGGKQEVELGRARCRHASAYWQRLKTTASGQWAGPPVGLPGEFPSLSIFCFCFLFLFLCFELVKMLIHFFKLLRQIVGTSWFIPKAHKLFQNIWSILKYI